MSEADLAPDPLRETLELEVARFRAMYPHSSVRFARLIGRRVSHVAGPVDDLYVGEVRMPVNSEVVMFVHNADQISPDALKRFAVQVATVLSF